MKHIIEALTITVCILGTTATLGAIGFGRMGWIYFLMYVAGAIIGYKIKELST